MIGQQHQVLVKTDDPNAIAPVWRTKLGSSRALVLGVYVDSALATIEESPAPVLRVRRPEHDTDDATYLELTAIEDDEDHQLELAWTAEQLAALGPGRFIADVVCTVGADEIAAPDSGYFVIEIIAGAGA
jgi:hypothetical protein